MASRLQLQSKLEELNGNRNVYYDPPTSLQMNYRAIRYSKKKPDVKHASDEIYSKMNCYELIVIDRLPDSPVIEQLMKLPYCSWDNHYVSNNLHHDVLTLYY